MKEKELTLDERRLLQLDMLQEIDAFCKNHNIRYSLAYGTLIGAIRHKGFIPWDDDVDIMMPLPDLLRFKREFHSHSMEYCDIDNKVSYEYAFPRICSLKTYSLLGHTIRSLGVCIDLYPILGLPNELDEINSFFKNANIILKKRMFLIHTRNVFAKFLPISTICGMSKYVKLYRDFLFQYPYEKTKMYFAYGGELEWRNVYDKDFFENIQDVDFEHHKFSVISEYDYFLKKFYGNYMQLPPENQRYPYHGGHYYWKNHEKI